MSDASIMRKKILNVHFFELIVEEAFLHRKLCKSTPLMYLLYRVKAKGRSLRESDKEVKKILLFLRIFLLKNSRSSEKMSKVKEFLKLPKEYKIIFWERFEQFLDFAKIYHLQKIKKILESS